MRSLLDVNVLVALFDQDHVDHVRVRAWLAARIDDGWASCPITQNGFVRVISQPAYPSPVTAGEAIRLLDGAVSTFHHEFWPNAVSVLDERVVRRRHVLGHRQVTAVHLLATAVANGGCLAMLDRSVPIEAVAGATADHLALI